MYWTKNRVQIDPEYLLIKIKNQIETWHFRTCNIYLWYVLISVCNFVSYGTLMYETLVNMYTRKHVNVIITHRRFSAATDMLICRRGTWGHRQSYHYQLEPKVGTVLGLDSALSCRNRNGHHNTEFRHILGQRKNIKGEEHGPPKNRGWTHVLAKGKQFLPSCKTLPCYSYIQSSSVKILIVTETRKHLRKK